ncbi:hypothetical protein GQ457_10G029430 [Hibiscus cannabinus]
MLFCLPYSNFYPFTGKKVSPFNICRTPGILLNLSTSSSAIATEEALPTESSEQFNIMEQGKVCSIREVEEAKAVLRRAPIWATSLIYAVVFAVTNIVY